MCQKKLQNMAIRVEWILNVGCEEHKTIRTKVLKSSSEIVKSEKCRTHCR
jgi:hypothetical protein